MANDDFTAHDDQLTPSAEEETVGNAAENPFYSEVPSADLVIEDTIVFDEPLPEPSPQIVDEAAERVPDFLSSPDAFGEGEGGPEIAGEAASEFSGDADAAADAGTDAESVAPVPPVDLVSAEATLAPEPELAVEPESALEPELAVEPEFAPGQEADDEAPHDYSVTDFGGAGTAVSIEADELEQGEEANLTDAGGPVEAEHGIVPQYSEPEVGEVTASASEEAPHDYLVTDFGGAGSPAVMEGESASDAVPAEEVPAFGDPSQSATFGADVELEADVDLTRPAFVPQEDSPNTLASNASLPQVTEELAEPLVEAASSPDEAPASEAAPAREDSFPAPLVSNDEPGATEVPPATVTPFEEAVPSVSAPAPHADEEPPAVASPIPVLRAERGDDSTWQEIHRRRSLFHPVSESSLEPAADSVPSPALTEETEGVGAAPAGDEAPAFGEDEAVAIPGPEVAEEEAEIHTTTIPVASSESVESYQPGPHSGEIPLDVLSGREKDFDELSTTALRRDLFAPAPASTEENTASWHQALQESATPLPAGDTPQKLDDAIFEGTTVIPVVPSRVGAHVASLLLTLLLVPLSWYFLADAGARMTLAEGAPIMSGQLSLWALAEFAIGILGLIVVTVLAVRSSLGAWVSGLLVTVLGLPWLVAPAAMMNLTQGTFDALSGFGVVGHNLAHHLQVSAYSGRLLLLGLALWAIGVVSHAVRRKGRAEEALRAEVERVNPTGAHLTWSGRRRAAKEAARRERARQ